jgi:exodeoxyribonuclease VII large subunit
MVRGALKNAFPATYKLVAEIAEISVNNTGHCYLSLVEKSETNDSLIASAKATIWASRYRMIKPYFETTTGRRLEKGMKVLVSVEVVFHETYGYSLNILDIDPSFTLGDIERRRREILDRLKKEGVLMDNKSHKIFFHPKKVAVISSPTAAGYGDFVNQLENNSHGFSFVHKLFPAVMQGDKASASIIDALNKIAEYDDFFDVVVLIRGGGSSSDLSCFDTYDLAYYMTQFPLPIIAGIGHERDVTIADTVAHTRVKTPTAAASFLIDMIAEIEHFINDRETRFLESLHGCIQDNKNNIKHISEVFAPKVMALLKQELGKQNVLKSNLRLASKGFVKEAKSISNRLMDKVDISIHYKISRHRDKLREMPKRLLSSTSHSFMNKKMNLDKYQMIVSLSDPEHLLKKGYSLTYANGVLVKDISILEAGQEIITKAYGGEISSTIKEINKK